MMAKNKYCMESIEFDCLDGEAKFWCNRDYGNHNVHEATGTNIDYPTHSIINGKKIAIKTNYTIQWTVTEMEIE